MAHVHRDDSDKESFPCDYKKCNRRKDPFFRKDHYRDHLREYHREDLRKRGNSDTTWLAKCTVYPDWWRCGRCLGRMEVAQAGFDCIACGHKCESDRQAVRVNMGKSGK